METTAIKSIAHLAEALVQNQIKHVVLSPGSRNAPLIIAFEAHPDIQTYLIHDERSAAFFALGMAEQLGVGVAIACTSGSAPLNYAPAVVEAYYRQIPLFVLTADRPAHLIDQGDGQCMRQENVYANYIKKSYTYPENLDLQLTDQVAKQAISSLLNEPKGPVHLNIPLSEPLYETEEFNEDLSLKINRFDDTDLSKEDENEVVDIWKNTAKKLVIVGQMEPNKGVQEMLSLLAGDPSVAILVENTSNVQHFAKFCHSIDRTLALISENEIDTFKPDLSCQWVGLLFQKKLKLSLEHIHQNIIGELDVF